MREIHDAITTHEGPPAEIGSACLRETAAYWLRIGGETFSARRCDIDPLDLTPMVLPRVWLVDYEAAAEEFRFRLAGEAINSAFGQPVRGACLGDLFPSRLGDPVRARFRRVIEEPCVCYCAGMVYVENERPGWGERLILPLADDKGRIRHLLGATDTDIDWQHDREDEGADPTARAVVERFFAPADLARVSRAVAPA